MIIPMLCVTIFVILVVWFLLPRVARLMIHTPTAISIFVCLSMVQLMAVFISMRCTLCGHFLQVARSEERRVGKEGRSRWSGEFYKKKQMRRRTSPDCSKTSKPSSRTAHLVNGIHPEVVQRVH